MFFTSLLALASALTLASAAPTTDHSSQQYRLQVKTQGTDPTIDFFNNLYVFYQQNGFFQDEDDLSFSKTTSEDFTIVGDQPMYDSKMGMQLGAIVESQSSKVAFTNATNDACIQILKKDENLYLNATEPTFGGWLVCVSQYDAILAWATNTFNLTASKDDGPPEDRCGYVNLLVAKV